MADWSKSMLQTFEFYSVNPNTWQDVKLIRTIKSATIDRDIDADTLGSAKIDATESLGEGYVRIYLIIIQNGVREKHPLGTFLIQTPSIGFDGMVKTISLDAYTPLIELKEKMPDIGYFTQKDADPLKTSYNLLTENNLVRAPVIDPGNDGYKLGQNNPNKLYENFVADPKDDWCAYIKQLLAKSKKRFMLTDLGEISFEDNKKIDEMKPTWTYTDDNSSILHPTATLSRDLYGIPNIVEVIYSDNKQYYDCIVYNKDPNSPVSIQSRGRTIIHRDTNPNIQGTPSKEQVLNYAAQLLLTLSSLECTISYIHGYCPVKIGDCIRLNYKRAGFNDIKALVKTQSISCTPGCSVTETATFADKLLDKYKIKYINDDGEEVSVYEP